MERHYVGTMGASPVRSSGVVQTLGVLDGLRELLVAHGTVDGLAVLLFIETLMHPHVLVSVQLLFDPNPDALFMEQMLAWGLNNMG